MALMTQKIQPLRPQRACVTPLK